MTHENPTEGLGDVVEKVITKIGDITKIEYIRRKKGCEGCRKRKEWLNEKFPFETPKPPAGGCSECAKKNKTCKDCGE